MPRIVAEAFDLKPFACQRTADRWWRRLGEMMGGD